MKHTEGVPGRQGAVRVVHARFAAAAGPGQAPPPPTLVEVAFAGRSNVGKSTLLNALCERRGLVRTGATPGVTRQLNWFHVTMHDGLQLFLVDLPGYGYARRSKEERRAWAALIEGYLRRRVTLAAVVLLVDARRGMEEEERELLALLAAPAEVARRPVSVVLVATKLDKVPRSRRAAALDELRRKSARRVLGFAATTGEGREDLWRELLSVTGLAAPKDAGPTP